MKKNITVTILVLVIGLLLVSTVYVSWILTRDSGSTRVAAKKTKAASITYSRIVNIADNEPTAAPLTTVTPAGSQADSISPLPTQTETADLLIPTVMAGSESSGVTPTGELSSSSETISPTEVLLAKDTSVITDSPSSVTVTPQQQNELPSTGWVSWTLPIFVAASLFIFLAFLY